MPAIREPGVSPSPEEETGEAREKTIKPLSPLAARALEATFAPLQSIGAGRAKTITLPKHVEVLCKVLRLDNAPDVIFAYNGSQGLNKG